ncbi:hypothetical protein Q8F55_001096 [Vanrija albida]|uniref:Dimethylaniline monooxygenase n=1 Tax=Vanrija albida TaxID=181172 RepID=A0ABR3QFA8_9TREE
MTTSLPLRTSTLIIGGGPSGLVALKYAKEYGPAWERGEAPVLVEMEPELGGTFRWRGYENAELVSSKQLTCFSDYRYPLSAPDHPSLPNFVEYLKSYSKVFGLDEHIYLNTRVVRLDKVGPEGYPHRAVLRRTGRQDDSEDVVVTARRVIITTGLHVTPNIPDIPGLNAPPLPPNPVEWIHSSAYHSRSQLQGKKVLILGSGETGMDLGYEGVLAPAKKVWMGVRSGFLSFPKVLNNFRVFGTTYDGALPIDGLITNLFETAYVHPWVASSHLRWFVSDFVIRRVLWLLTGTMAGCNQWAGELPPERQGRAFVFLNKSGKAMQFINRPFAHMSALHRAFFHYIDPPLPRGIDDPTIDIVPFPERFDPNDGSAVLPPPPAHRSKETAWKSKCDPDLVVLATGYRQDFDWIGEGYPRPEKANLRGVCDTSDLSVAFLGFLRPGVGAIPPMAEMQAQFFFLVTQGKIAPPTSPENYHLLHSEQSRIQYGVDYSAYMSQLARDMGSAPGLLELWWKHGWFITLIYCFGAAFPTFYRLSGPYQSPRAPRIVETELWDTIKRRGVAGNLFMGVIPMAFYAFINILALWVDVVWTLAAPILGIRRPPKSSYASKLLNRAEEDVTARRKESLPRLRLKIPGKLSGIIS